MERLKDDVQPNENHMNKLLILSNNAKEYAQRLGKRALPDLEISIYDGPDCSESLIREANIILGQPALVSEVLERAEQLEWVQSSFAGIEPLQRDCKNILR
jgi:phosphoglycerate dehydrogenase-like enzyme